MRAALVPYIEVTRGGAAILRDTVQLGRDGRYRWPFLERESGAAWSVAAATPTEAVNAALRALSTGEVIWRR